MSYELRIEDNIAVFCMKNGKVNPIGSEILVGLDEILDRLNEEEELKGLILIGEGRYFSSGFDLRTFTAFKDAEEIINWFRFEEETLLKLFTCPKPVVAAINGHATAAGMIVSMACDYRIVLNHPKIKLGMTEIKIGLALTPAEHEIMSFGLDTDKNFREVIFKGELFNPEWAAERQIVDELADNADDLLTRAKTRVSALIDTPGRPFIMLKRMQKQHSADWIRAGLDGYEFSELVKVFTDPAVQATLTAVRDAVY